jgi:hypothetical protein
MTEPTPVGDDRSEIVVREIGATTTSDLAQQWGAAYATAIRFAAGVAGVLADRAGEITREVAASAQAGETQPSELDLETQPSVPGTILFGFAADLPARFGRVTTTVADSTGLVREITGYGWRLVAASPIGWLVSKPVDAVRERMDAESERLYAIGRTEVARGKTLVGTAMDTTIDVVLDNVSESEALNDLIRDKAAGVTDLAIQEVRETGAAADNITDTAIRRLLRRPQRPLPPKPAANE